jgi:hypothetical protein
MWERIVPGGIAALVVGAVGLGQAFAFCETTIRQAEADVTQVEASARASTDGADPALQVRLDNTRALVKEAWDLRNRGDHTAALGKAKAALALLPSQGSPRAAQTPARGYAYETGRGVRRCRVIMRGSFVQHGGI